MVLTHGSNSIGEVGVGLDFLFYTDFSNYDLSTRTDTPLVGQLGTYNSSIFLSPHNNGGPFGKNYGSITFGTGFPQMSTMYKTIVHNKEFVSLTGEVWMKGNVNGAYIGLVGSQTLLLDNRVILLLSTWDSVNAQTTTYNGATYHTATSNVHKYIIVPSSVSITNWNHIAVVYTPTSIYGYVNGTLYGSITNQTKHIYKFSDSSIVLNGTGSSGVTELGYLSWRIGDKSINDHQTFPVPTSPYL